MHTDPGGRTDGRTGRGHINQDDNDIGLLLPPRMKRRQSTQGERNVQTDTQDEYEEDEQSDTGCTSFSCLFLQNVY